MGGASCEQEYRAKALEIIVLTLTLAKLDLMFMKHYAPNRCLYIKVAKLRTGVEYRDIIPTNLQCQAIQRALQSPNLQREIIQKK